MRFKFEFVRLAEIPPLNGEVSIPDVAERFRRCPKAPEGACGARGGARRAGAGGARAGQGIFPNDQNHQQTTISDAVYKKTWRLS